MTSLTLLLLLLLSVSLHACTLARPLTTKDKGILDTEKLVLLTTSSVKDCTKEEHQVLQQEKVTNNDLNICEHCSTANKKATRPMLVLDERRHARSMLGPARHHHIEEEETVVTNDSDNAEDIVEMDYAQPHRKPPIHNEKP